MLNDCDLIVINIEPMGKPRLSRADIWRERPSVVRWYAYKDELKCKLRNYHLPEQLDLEFYLPMPDSWSQHKKTIMAGQPHLQKPDVDNLAKGFMDALTDDDAQVWNLHALKLGSWEGRIAIYRTSCFT